MLQKRTQIRSTSGVNLALGIWLIVSAATLALTGAAVWNNVIFGIAIAALATARVSKPEPATRAASWVNAAIGVWLVISPFALNFAARGAVWNNVIAGALVVVLALWSLSGMQPAGTVSSRTPADRAAAPNVDAAQRMPPRNRPPS